MTAQELLVFFQRTNGNVNNNQSHLQEAIKLYSGTDYEWIINHLESSYREMPTDFQDTFFYNIIKSSFDVLSNTLKDGINFDGSVVSPQKIPLFGTVNSGEFNAFISATDEVPLIVFNNGLIMFTERIIELYCKERWLISKGLMSEAYREKLIKNFLDIMICYHVFDNPCGTIPFDLSDMKNFDDLSAPDKIAEYLDTSNAVITEITEEYLRFEWDVRNSTYLWMVSHEYAHMLLGHLDNSPLKKKMIIGDSELTKYCFEWNHEYEADLLAANITMQSESGFYLSTGIYLALACLQFSTIFVLSEEKRSHPPTRLRITAIISYLENCEYIINNLKNVDTVLIPKFEVFRKLIVHINNLDSAFTSLIEIQKYIYKEFDWNA